MEPKDLSLEIAEISKHYIYPKTPAAVSTFEDLILRILRYLVDYLNSLNFRIPYPTHENIMAMYMMVAVFIIALIAISLMVVLLIKSVKNSQTKIPTKTLLDADVEQLIDSASWLSVAAELASEKNFRSACRAVFLSALLTLDEMSIAEFAPALSNYEYLYKLSRYKKIQSTFRQLANAVDLIWFGNHEAQLSDYQDCLKLQSQIKTQAEDATRARSVYVQ